MSSNVKKMLVCLPVYNEARLLKRAVNSILEQTYDNFSLVIVNDGSTDNSLEEANKFLYDERVIVVNNEKNGGCFYSKNTGIKFMESGDFDVYTTHDADDFSQQDRFEKVMKTFSLDNSIISVQDHVLRIGNKPPSWHSRQFQPVINYAHGFFNKEVFEKIGYFDNMGYNSDQEYKERIDSYCELNNKTSKTIEEVLYYAEITDDNMILKYGHELREKYRNLYRSEIKQMSIDKNFYRNFFNYEERRLHV